MKTNEIEMTGGPLAKNILLFSLPLVLSNVLQVLFNLADVAVAGKFAGPIALGAVGSTTTLVALTTWLPMGFAAGVNSINARYVGANDEDKIRKCVHTSFLISVTIGFILLVAGIFLSGPVLKLMGTKNELFDGARTYLIIYLLGSPALCLYNYGNAVLSSIGDTKRPFRYLLTAGIINVMLNMFFVIVLHLDVKGVAFASVISQYVSAFLIIGFLVRCRKVYGISLKHISFDREVALKVASIGIPTALQYSVFAISNICIQSAVNSFSHIVVEGNSAAANADNLVYDVMAAFYTACTSFTAQNYGATKKERIMKVYGITLTYSAFSAMILGALLVLFRTQFLSLFTSDLQVIEYGKTRLVIMSCSYFISAFMDDSAAAARGLGRSRIPTVFIVLGSVVYRVIWVYTVFAYFHTLSSLYLVYATAWTFTAIILNLYLFGIYRNLHLI